MTAQEIRDGKVRDLVERAESIGDLERIREVKMFTPEWVAVMAARKGLVGPPGVGRV